MKWWTKKKKDDLLHLLKKDIDKIVNETKQYEILPWATDNIHYEGYYYLKNDNLFKLEYVNEFKGETFDQLLADLYSDYDCYDDSDNPIITWEDIEWCKNNIKYFERKGYAHYKYMIVFYKWKRVKLEKFVIDVK